MQLGLKNMRKRQTSYSKEIYKNKIHKLLMGSREKDGLLKQIFVYALLICIGFVYLYPILYMISRSFMSVDDLLDTSISWIPSKLNFDNYIQSAQSMHYFSAFLKSIVVTCVPTALNVIICSVVGYGFARFEFRFKKLFMALLIFSYILPPQITMMPTYVLFNDMKLTNTLWSFIIPALFGQGLNAPIFILIFYQFFKQVPKVLIEAAHIDGAGYFKSFLRISIPSAIPAIITVVLFSIVWYWNESYLTQLYVSGVTSDKGFWTTLIIQLKEFDVNYTNYDIMATQGASQDNNESIRMAATTLSIAPVLVTYFIMQRFFVESIDRTGITGE